MALKRPIPTWLAPCHKAYERTTVGIYASLPSLVDRNGEDFQPRERLVWDPHTAVRRIVNERPEGVETGRSLIGAYRLRGSRIVNSL